jgi:hypothetical protein
MRALHRIEHDSDFTVRGRFSKRRGSLYWREQVIVHNSDGNGTGGSMPSQDGTADSRQPISLRRSEVVELMLLLTRNQFSALEVLAGRLNLTIGELIRRTVGDYLLQPMPVSNCGEGAGGST